MVGEGTIGARLSAVLYKVRSPPPKHKFCRIIAIVQKLEADRGSRALSRHQSLFGLADPALASFSVSKGYFCRDKK